MNKLKNNNTIKTISQGNNLIKRDEIVSHKKYYIILAIISFVLFANTLVNGYNLDDELVTRNHNLTSQGIKSTLSIFKSFYYQDDMGYSYGYRPIVHLSFAIEHQLFGEKASISHLINLIVYLLIVLFLFKFFLNLTSSKHINLIFLSVLIFAVHPVHTEVVASIKNRDELLALLFAILSGIHYINFLKTTKNWKQLIIASFYFGLAILSKESIYPLVFISPMLYLIFLKPNWVELHIVSISMISPVFFISYNMEIKSILMLLITPILWTSIISFINENSSYSSFKLVVFKTIENWTFSIFSFVIIVFLVSLTSNYLFVLLGLLIIFINVLNNKILGYVFTTCLMYFFFYFFGDYLILEILITITLLYFIFNQDKKHDFKPILSIVFGSVIVLFILDFFFRGFDFGIISRLIGFTVLLILIKVNRILGVLSILFIVVLLFFSIYECGNVEVPFILASLFVISIFSIAKIYLNYFSFKFILILVFTVATFFSFLSYISLSKINTKSSFNVKLYNSLILQKNEASENRTINYVENTLVKTNSNSQKIATGIVVLGEYFRLMIFPYELSFYYGFSKVKTEDFKSLKVWISLITHLLLVVFVIWNFTKSKFMFLGLFWYLISILLFSNWIELVPGMIGERLAFTASAGFSIFLAGLICWVKPDFNWSKPKFLEWSVFIVLFLFAAKTFVRNADWKDAITLMGNDIKHIQNSAQANNLYALNLMKTSAEASTLSTEQVVSMQKLAAKHFKRAIEIYPNFSNAWYDLSRVYIILNDNNNAIESLKKTIILNSEFQDAYIDLLSIYETKNDRINHLKYARLYFQNIQDPEAIVLMAKSFVANQKIDSAQLVLNNGLIKYKNNARLLNNISELKSFIENN